MTLGENKKIALSLIEEYAPNNALLTDDEDIQTKLNLIYNPAYFEMARLKKIRKTYDIVRTPGTTEKYTEYSLPSDLYQIDKLVAFDSNGVLQQPDYYELSNKLYINDLSEYTYRLLYFAYPTPITETTLNTFSLEIDLDVQNILPYVVVADILKADPSANYVAFENRYMSIRNSLDPRNKVASISVENSKYDIS